MAFIVDASVAIKWFVSEAGHDRARALLTAGDELFAPDLLMVEIGNVGWKKVVKGEIDLDQAIEIALSVRSSLDEVHDSTQYLAAAVAIAVAINHPVYDCIYLACARQSGATLVTADRRLLRSIASTPYRPLAVDLAAL